VAPRLAARRDGPLPETITAPQHSPVIIAGFGRYGQVVGRLLSANGLAATVLDHDADQVDAIRRFGWPVFYGDATRLDLLRMAGAAEAKVLVLAIDDVEQSVDVARTVREHFPALTVVARARNVSHYGQLRDLGVKLIERETLDSALMSGRSVLEVLGWQPHAARNSALRFRQHTIDQLHATAPHQGDRQKLIAVAKQGREQLERLWAQEREAADALKQRRAWAPQADDPPTG
jgi:glutathione-regulated potassium-efflux system ancillary protein KefC